MELKPGYKQTEVGVIPEDWDVKRLRDISPSQSVGLVINPSSYFEANGEVPMLVGSCISENKINAEKASRISSKNSERLSACRLKAGDLVTVRVGFPGTTAVVPTGLDGCNCASMMIIRRHKSFDSYWLAQLLNSPIGRVQIENVEYGTAQKQFNISDAIDFIFPVPPPAEQSKIAEAAKNFDEYIESLEQKIEKKRRIKQATMQELLTGKRRLPGFEGEWEVKRLGDIAEITMGQSPSSTNYNTHGRGMPLIQGNADIKNRETVERVFTTQITKRGFKGDILMSVRAPVGEVSRATIDVCLGRGVCAIRFPNNFLYHYLIFLEPTWAKYSKGSTFDSVNSADLKAIDIHLPCDSLEQIAIAEYLALMDAELTTLEMRLTKAHALKQGMMQQLLTGKIRLR